MRVLLMSGAAVLAASLALVAGDAFAANPIQKECAAKYQAAKAANTLNGMKYNDYYKQCAAAAKAGAAAGAAPAATPAATPAPAPAAPTPAPTAAPVAPKPAPAPTTTAARPAPAPTAAAPGGAVFPTAISPEFSTLKPGDARRKTCSAQYQANKATNGNGGMKWAIKGGGYYSECNKRLKG